MESPCLVLSSLASPWVLLAHREQQEEEEEEEEEEQALVHVPLWNHNTLSPVLALDIHLCHDVVLEILHQIQVRIRRIHPSSSSLGQTQT